MDAAEFRKFASGLGGKDIAKQIGRMSEPDLLPRCSAFLETWRDIMATRNLLGSENELYRQYLEGRRNAVVDELCGIADRLTEREKDPGRLKAKCMSFVARLAVAYAKGEKAV